jgi:two-component system OmpR family response regulator
MSRQADVWDDVGRKHIVIVNRDPAFLAVSRLLLQEQEDYTVTTTNVVPRTFEQIATLQPSLLMLDLTIGDQAGWELLKHLEAEAITRQIPVIVTATDPRLLDQAKANQHRYTGDYFLVKPFNIDTLLDAIHALIG